MPSSVAEQLVAPDEEQPLPTAFQLPPVPVAVIERLPTSADQLIGALNEEELGLPASSLDELLEWARLLPFEPLMLLLARVAAEVWHVRDDADAQLQILASMDCRDRLNTAPRLPV